MARHGSQIVEISGQRYPVGGTMAREIDDTHDIAQLGARKAGDTPLGHTQPGMVQWREKGWASVQPFVAL